MSTAVIVAIDALLLAIVVVAHLRERDTVPRASLMEAALTWPVLAVVGSIKTLISPPGNRAVAIGVGAIYVAALACTLGHPYRISEPYLKDARPLARTIRVQLATFAVVVVAALLWVVSGVE